MGQIYGNLRRIADGEVCIAIEVIGVSRIDAIHLGAEDLLGIIGRAEGVIDPVVVAGGLSGQFVCGRHIGGIGVGRANEVLAAPEDLVVKCDIGRELRVVAQDDHIFRVAGLLVRDIDRELIETPILLEERSGHFQGFMGVIQIIDRD